MISSRHIEVFYHVYNEGSLTRAAKALNVSQPLVSKTLAYAEHKLKLKLFVRHARRLSPTPEADILFKHAADVNQQISKFNNIAENLVSDKIKQGDKLYVDHKSDSEILTLLILSLIHI